MNRSRYSFALRLTALAALCLCIPACGPSRVTKENYDRIQTNMTEAEVQAILGPPNDAPGFEQVGFGVKQGVWKDGNNVISVSFLNGRVSGKGFVNVGDMNGGKGQVAINADGNKFEFKVDVNQNNNGGGGVFGNPPQKQNVNNNGGGFGGFPQGKPIQVAGGNALVTKANFDRIQNGMTEAQVNAILGAASKRTVVGGVTFLEWNEPGKFGYLISLHMHDGKVQGRFVDPGLK